MHVAKGKSKIIQLISAWRWWWWGKQLIFFFHAVVWLCDFIFVFFSTLLFSSSFVSHSHRCEHKRIKRIIQRLLPQILLWRLHFISVVRVYSTTWSKLERKWEKSKYFEKRSKYWEKHSKYRKKKYSIKGIDWKCSKIYRQRESRWNNEIRQVLTRKTK